jgi:hypothetical protein
MGDGESTQVSIVDLIKADLRELEESEEVYIPISGFGRTNLAAKYKLPESGKQLDIIARNVMRDQKDQYDRNLHIAVRTMILLNDGLYVKPDGVEEYVQLDPEETGIPISFKDGSRFHEVFGWPADTTPLNAMRHLFGNNEVALLAHSEKLARWMRDTKADLTIELWDMGEVSLRG